MGTGSVYPSKSVELLAEFANEVCGVVGIVRGDQGLCLVCSRHFVYVLSSKELSTRTITANIFC